ncbi:hypothetical protein D3C75_1187530 [compost metagenome]
MEQHGVEARRGDQAQLEDENVIGGEVVRVGGKHHQPGRNDHQQSRNGPWQEMAGEGRHLDIA